MVTGMTELPVITNLDGLDELLHIFYCYPMKYPRKSSAISYAST